ncbi:hypothetical protein BJ085DRAFT_23335 [Dimargaris cristalligena]|uniref:Pre-mRNA-splicing factor SYF1 n=1 Tax=Dimargaris cristalligena TaxID=215637 RepID=A0A4P9ZXT4_9FUNG|nr:hypothetical protein BJ085DRAFT_23335 [Dimargaris cristalligena]|eukprot:RKP38467.1 hypothetical protein BJ085DRAFT_23335 [Dimargaris cristalligena]
MSSQSLQALESLADLTHIRIPDDDLAFEDDIVRNPNTLRCWLRYLDHKADAPISHRVFLYERAVHELPGSYKLWKAYLDLRVSLVRGWNPVVYADHYKRVNLCFERALILLHKMPRLWLDYTALLAKQRLVTQTRRTFDRALRSLPITQHDRIWQSYIRFADHTGGETALRAYRRYIKLEPQAMEVYIALLKELRHYDEAAVRLVEIIENERFVSPQGTSRYQLWTQLCGLLCDHPRAIRSIRAEPIIRSGIRRFADQAGALWADLARYWILLDQPERARDVFEEGIRTAMTVRDFGQVFEAYQTFLTVTAEAALAAAARREEEAAVEQGGAQGSAGADLDLDLLLLRLEDLASRRPFLVNDVVLRQNPHNVLEWLNRVDLWASVDESKVVPTYTDAVAAIHPKKAVGKLHDLWIRFARYFEDHQQPEEAREVWERAVRVDYKSVNDLAEVWCAYADMEVRLGEFDRALAVLGRATAPPVQWQKVKFHDDSVPTQKRVFKSIRLWTHYLDLEESLGTMEATKAAYDQVMSLKIATPQIIVNYAQFLQERNYFEESFKVYERGVDQFGYPVAFELWNLYLTQFTKRFGGTKLERTRDLFEQALVNCPPEYAKPLYLLYGEMEETHGSSRHAMRIYERATQAVTDGDRLAMFQFYIAKTSQLFGIVATREIYERALEVLPDTLAREMGQQYAEVELKLGEIDRARALYGYTSQLCEPRTCPAFWKTWHEFEVKHGNEETFKEMMRVKRSVTAKYNTDSNYVAARVANSRQAKPAAAASAGSGGSGETLTGPPALTETKSRSLKFVPSSTSVPSLSAPPQPAVKNPNELAVDIDDDDDDDDNDNDNAGDK